MTECCAAMDQIMAEFDGPFERPWILDPESKDMATGSLVIRLYKLTSTGNVSRKGGAVAKLNYCPFCATQLREMQ